MTSSTTLLDLTVPAPPAGAADWNDVGVVCLPGLIDQERINAYQQVWSQENGYRGLAGPSLNMVDAERPNGWPDCTPYMRHQEILELVAPIAPHLEKLLGEPAGMSLNLTGWVSTERNWHQDSYLNEPEVGDYYAAVWVALGNVHPDSGPFQYVPGSHRWPQVTRESISRHVDLSDPHWPWYSEEVLTPLFTAAIADRGAHVVTHLPQAGDVLIWHGRLLHRGSAAKAPGIYRPGFIAHFSGVHHRSALPAALPYPGGGWYFPILS